MSEGRVVFAREGAVARITLDRPARLNALTPAMLAALGDTVGRIDADDDIRAVVLSATGDRPSASVPTSTPGPAPGRSTCGATGCGRATPCSTGWRGCGRP